MPMISIDPHSVYQVLQRMWGERRVISSEHEHFIYGARIDHVQQMSKPVPAAALQHIRDVHAQVVV